MLFDADDAVIYILAPEFSISLRIRVFIKICCCRNLNSYLSLNLQMSVTAALLLWKLEEVMKDLLCVLNLAGNFQVELVLTSCFWI